MKRHLWGLGLAGLLIGLAGCAGDPTESISGTATRIVPTYSQVFLFPGDSILVLAEVRDAQGVALPILATVTSDDETLVGVSDAYVPPLQQTRFYIRGDAVGGTKVTLSAAGLTETILVSVFPDVFEGNVSVVTTAILDTVVINVGTSGLLFVPGETNVLIDGTAARIVVEAEDELKVIPRTSDALDDVTLTIENLVFLAGTEYESNIATLDAADPIDVSGEDNEPGNDDPATATAITVGGAALEGFITDTDIDDFFTFTLAAPADVTVTVSFDGGGGDPDIDVFLLNAAGGGFCVLDGCAMATGSMPEETTVTLPAGTYTVLVEYYDAGAAEAPFWYRVKLD
jgi:hypothetical protein